MTPKQRKAFDFIEAYMAEHGYAPSYDEISSALNINSKGGVHRMLEALRNQGLITKRKGEARSIKLVPQRSAKLHVIKSAIMLYDENACSAEATIDAIRATIRSMDLMP